MSVDNSGCFGCIVLGGLKLMIAAVVAVLVISFTGCSGKTDAGNNDTQTHNDNGSDDDQAAADIKNESGSDVSGKNENGNTADNNAENGNTKGTHISNPDLKAVTIDLSVEHQVMDGFGAAYTWYGDRLLNSKDPEGGLDALFSDAKLTILRFKNEYSYHVDGKAANAVAMAKNYKEARDRAAQYGERVYVLMCCWSPPAYLKSDNSIATGYGTLAKNEAGEYVYDEYAEWWVESLKYYMARGIVVDYVSIQNEVDYAPEDYEGCLFGPKETATQASYAKAFLAVYNALHREFGDDAPKMLGPETMSCVPSTLLKYTSDIINENPDALEGVAYHLYVGGTSDNKTNTVKATSYMTNFSGLKNSFSDIRRWETEFYIGKGIQTAELIHSALTIADMTAYLYWSGVWNDSTPDRFESFDLIEINDNGEWRKTANYYVMRHYSQFIRPGYTRVDAASAEAYVKPVAFVSPYKNKMAVVLVNPFDREITCGLEIDDYTITDSVMYRSVFGEDCKSEEGLFENIGAYDGSKGITLPAYSVVSIDITGYQGDAAPEVPAVTPIVYDTEVITEEIVEEAGTEDKLIMSKHFETAAEITAFAGMGSSRGSLAGESADGTGGCMAVTGRSDAWNGVTVPTENFEHYGYLMYVSYDCMSKTGGCTVSCTSTFTVDSAAYYPNVENNRVVCENLEAGKWKHAEGYVTLYTNMDPGTFRIYWESPDNTDDFYLDNVEIKILYSTPAGEFIPQ